MVRALQRPPRLRVGVPGTSRNVVQYCAHAAARLTGSAAAFLVPEGFPEVP